MIETGHGWQPGLIGWIAAEHGRYYQREWNFNATFEAIVAEGLGSFFQRYDPERDRTIWASKDGAFLASLTIDGSDPCLNSDQAHLRWFIVSDAARGTGLGRRLMNEGAAFLKGAGYRRCYLTTFAGLDAARRLYEDYGYQLTEEAEDTTWGTPVLEQRFDLLLPGV